MVIMKSEVRVVMTLSTDMQVVIVLTVDRAMILSMVELTVLQNLGGHQKTRLFILAPLRITPLQPIQKLTQL